MKPSHILHPATKQPFIFHPVDISSSELKTFDKCGGAWLLKYILGQRPKVTKTALTIGGIVHEVLAEYYEPTTPDHDRDAGLLIDLLNDIYKERLTLDLEDSGKAVYKTLHTMMTSYWEAWGGRDWTLTDTEVNFRTGIFLRSRLVGFIHGRLDGLTILKDNKIWIIDHKTTKQFKTAHFIVDPQIDLYCLGGSKLFGNRFGGLIINYIRSRQSKKSPNFQRIPVVRSLKALTLIEYNLALKLLDLGSLDPTQIYFSPNPNCTWMCEFLFFCKGLRAGVEPQVLLERSYKLRPPVVDEDFD